MTEGFSILIPYHGQYTFVRELIGSIVLYTRKIPYRITIVDDASPNKDFFASLAQHTHIDGIRLEQQSGFGAAINIGVKMTKLPWIVVLNSDCVIEDVGWLIEMYKTLCSLKDKNVAFVSARSDNPPGDNPLLKTEQLRDNVGDIVSDKALPIFCSLFSRKMYEDVGPIKEYPYGWYEDEEYFWRMKTRGYRQAISGKAWIRHHGGKTVQELWQKDPEIKTIMEGNRQKCLADLKKLFGR